MMATGSAAKDIEGMGGVLNGRAAGFGMRDERPVLFREVRQKYRTSFSVMGLRLR